jgi:3-phenylpropionate/trans-cinnamate dioxygenase ferredoxin reductase component
LNEPVEQIRRVVVIGAGQAGGEAALRLRQSGFDGEITIIGEEAHAPYQRPPLSKAYLKGELAMDRVLLREREVFSQERIDLRTEMHATGIDRQRRTVALTGGGALDYDAVILATGARPRPLPIRGSDLDGVHLFRTAADADRLRPALGQGAKLIVIGAGFIGLETAAVARQLGVDVTVVEAAERPLARVTSPEVSAFYLAEHINRGVRFVCNAQPVAIAGDSQARRVEFADGSILPADAVVVGIGVTPEISLAHACGLSVANGIETDAQCRTSDPAIFAIGDCAARPMSHYGGRVVRLESVHNAIEGAKIAAAAICGRPAPALEAPWFWSDQFDLKLQIAGLFQGYDRAVTRGSIASRSFATFYYQSDRLIAADAVNRPAEFLAAKLLIQTGRSIPASAISNEATPIKQLMSEAVAHAA